jgi:hypothetical protein
MSNLPNKKLNERLKLVANTLNTIAILGSTGAVVVPALQATVRSHGGGSRLPCSYIYWRMASSISCEARIR